MVKQSVQNGGENEFIMTVRDVAKFLRLSEAKVYRLVKDGCIPSFRLGGSWRFRKDLLEEWTRSKTQPLPERINVDSSVHNIVTLPTIPAELNAK
jgi:excisionase family DNA binding protein